MEASGIRCTDRPAETPQWRFPWLVGLLQARKSARFSGRGHAGRPRACLRGPGQMAAVEGTGGAGCDTSGRHSVPHAGYNNAFPHRNRPPA